LSGAIVGLVAITPCCGFVHLQSSLAIGCISSLVAWPLMHVKSRYLAGRWLMKYVDDSPDVFLCHGVGGMLGAFLLGWFASLEVNPAGADGVLFGGGKLLGWQVRVMISRRLRTLSGLLTHTFSTAQIIAILITIALSVVGTASILLFLRFTIGIRYSPQTQGKGADSVAHLSLAYRYPTQLGPKLCFSLALRVNQTTCSRDLAVAQIFGGEPRRLCGH
jgi:Amt family ammonium transporter